jgi:hypothetical protein
MPEGQSITYALWIASAVVGFTALHYSVMAYDSNKEKIKLKLVKTLFGFALYALGLFCVWILVSTIRLMWMHPLF